MSRYSSLTFHRHASSSFVPTHPQSNSVLTAKIREKKYEYENLLQLKELSAKLVIQMEQLEKKMETLVGGTEAVASVLENWQNVFRIINIASARLQKKAVSSTEDDIDMPETLVRIPISN
ncbi:uncharacterized protein T551_00669 [Pneumocystis jirovecii RU7]|uniref:DASH complex subunit DAD2 n=1 Tax=Pneumocystis jirovecii (strain RU7) TaxID=1408657 RepID=A0A0W4ZUG4_PNEJ7|nr:uncharacterized protein T551_00669 [Pneumocystis jirovecii RU7]KTW31987.1 hypothetical protein T551_00669 [Pneumocystis jirovecii RU7]